jgi:hypothetical protein
VGRTSRKEECAAKGLPSPAYWPHCVRNPLYYLGAYHLPHKEDQHFLCPKTLEAGAGAVIERHFRRQLKDLWQDVQRSHDKHLAELRAKREKDSGQLELLNK